MTDVALSVEEIESILKHWENKIDGVKWSDDTRESVIELLTEFQQTVEWWMKHLIKVPPDILDRYRAMMLKLFESRMITKADYDEELRLMERTSLAELTRQGKKAAEWYRQEEQFGFPCKVY